MEKPEATARKRLRLLLVDDERDILGVLSEILEEYGFTVVSTWEGEDAVEIADLYKPDVLLTDFRLPGIDGVTVIQMVREESPKTQAILMSGYVSPDTRERAAEEQVEHILEKPLSIPELLRVLKSRRAAS